MDQVQIITILFAVYGTILSTILGAYKIRENRRVLMLTMSRVLIDEQNGVPKHILGLNGVPMHCLGLSCTNIGKRPITITGYGLMDSKGKIITTRSFSSEIGALTLSTRELFGPDKPNIEVLYRGGIAVRIYSNDNVPKTLNDGDRFNAYVPLLTLAKYLDLTGKKGLVKVIGYFQDTTDKKYKKKHKFEASKSENIIIVKK